MIRIRSEKKEQKLLLLLGILVNISVRNNLKFVNHMMLLLAPAHREVDAIVMKSIEGQLALIKNSKKKIDVEKKREIVSKMSLLKKYRLQRSACRRLGITSETPVV